jgi:(R)-2-hydroxyacyl-CoA dehydratese activating ATPase
MNYYLGVDIGSGYTKAVIFGNNSVKSYIIIPSGGNYKNTVNEAVRIALSKAKLILKDISGSIATGSGAANSGFTSTATDISCHAAGIHFLYPSVRTVIDIGSMFSKAIRLNEEGKATNFLMNEKCAGGSGKFLQIIARILQMNIDDIGKLSLKALNPVQFTTSCAVFAESEAVSRIAEGASAGDIVAGVHNAIASKIATMVTRIGLSEDCAVTGGGAKDIGLVKSIESELKINVKVADEPQISAALGAAILALNSCV